jgi:hypothetical protein
MLLFEPDSCDDPLVGRVITDDTARLSPAMR